MCLDHRTRTLFGIGVAFCALFMASSRATAQSVQNMPIQGGSGGGNFGAQCPKGAPLIGVWLTSGAWVNSIAGQCLTLRVVPSRSVIVNTSIVGTTAGPKTQEARCGLGQSLEGIKYGFTRDGNKPKYVDYVQLICRETGNQNSVLAGCLGTGDGCWDRHPSPGSYNGYGLAFESRCLPGQVAVGLIGRSGSYVDALAIQCSPDKTPAAPTPPPPGPNPPQCGSGNNNCSVPPNPNRCCSVPYSDPTTGGIGVTHTCGPACP